MYKVAGIGITIILLYLLSFFFSKSGFYADKLHRRIWNYTLLFFFVSAASAGIFLALQVNYKWEIPFVKTILKWHVECGIGLSFVALIHLSGRFKYFLKATGTRPAEMAPPLTAPLSAHPGSNFFLLGFVSSSLQILLLRETMNITGGYELLSGIFLASWLISSSAGATAARSSGLNDLKWINISFALSAPVSVLLIPALAKLFLHPGELPTFFISVLFTLIILVPVTFMSGFSFIKLSTLAEQNQAYKPGTSFAIETSGGVAAGVLISVAASGLLNTYQLILIVFLLNLLYIQVTFPALKNLYKAGSAAVTLAILITLIFTNPDRFFRQQLLPGIKVIDSYDTPYGNYTSGVYGRDTSFWYNNHLLSWQNNESESEENVHYAMLQHRAPQNVLVISGDIKSLLPEIEKYNINKVIYVESDPALTGRGRNADNKVKLSIVTKDALRFIKSSRDSFDIVLNLLPPPSTLMHNRYYTFEFVKEIKNRLGKAGIYLCSPGAGENYFNSESKVLYSSIYNTLKSAFKNVIPVVGNKLYLLASDSTLSTSICKLVSDSGIENLYVNPDFMSDDLITMKSSEFVKFSDPSATINSLSNPVAVFHFQKFSLSKSLGSTVPAIVISLLVFMLPVLFIKRRNLTIYSSACALAAFEIIALLVLQSGSGNMYRLSGLIIASAMSGLAIGSAFQPFRFKALTQIITIAICLAVWYILSGLVVGWLMESISNTILIVLIVPWIIVPSILTGQILRLLTAWGNDGNTFAAIYSSDLAGSALGFIGASAISVPLLGISKTLFLLGAIIFAGFLFGSVRYK